MRPSSRDRIVEMALDTAAAAQGTEVTLDAVARAANLTKQGIAYHFPSKRALRRAMLHLILQRWEAEMEKVLEMPLAEADIASRIRAYARVASTGRVIRGDNVVFTELLYRGEDVDEYADWAETWFRIPETLPQDVRTRLTTAWLAANGLWSVLTTQKRRLTTDDADAVLAMIDSLTR